MERNTGPWLVLQKSDSTALPLGKFERKEKLKRFDKVALGAGAREAAPPAGGAWARRVQQGAQAGRTARGVPGSQAGVSLDYRA